MFDSFCRQEKDTLENVHGIERRRTPLRGYE